MQNSYYPSEQYSQFDPELQSGNSSTPYGAAGNNMYAPMNGYGGPPQMGQYYPQQGHAQMSNMNGPPMQQFNGYTNPQHSQQQFEPSYGPSHMASYANGPPNRRSTLTVLPVMDISMPPLAVKVFAEREEDGRPVPPMFLTAPNHDAGVVNIQHNPFNIRVNEILVALGQECLVQDYPQSSGIYAVHIIQDRMTGKTNDIYVELKDWAEAEKVMRRYNAQASRERGPKLGSRRAKMALATSSHMMKAIFPRAKCTWVNGQPERPQQWLVDNPCQWDGFITKEEMVKVLLFAEQPTSSKTRFAQDSPERVYQFMISSMQKIPWDADRYYFPKGWVMEFHAVLSRMAVRLANLVKDRQHVNLDSKLLEQFMKVMQSSPMYGNGDPKAMENYMSIATKIDDIMSMAHNVAVPPRRRGTSTSNTGGYRSESRVREDSALMEGLRGMHLVDRHAEARNRSPARRNQSPTRREYSPVRRDQSPVRRNQSPAPRDQSPVRREYSPVRREYSPVRRDHSPARRSNQYVSEYSSRASRRATTSGSPQHSSSSGRRSTLQFSGSSHGRSRRYDD